MTAPRVLVRNQAGDIREVAATAVPVMAPGGWQPLTEDELDAYKVARAEEKAQRRAALLAHSQRPRAAAPAPRRPKRSGGRGRPESTTDETPAAVEVNEATEQQKDED